MILGVMSDTHDNIELAQRCVELMVNKYNVKTIVHLGDDMSDLERIDTHGFPVIAVPGIYEAAWKNKNIPNRIIKEFDGVVFLFSHTPNRVSQDGKGAINPEKARRSYGVDVLLHGHTHTHLALESEDGLIVINPGHLKSNVDRSNEASFAILDFNDEKLKVMFISPGDRLLESDEFDVHPSGIMNSEDSTTVEID